MEEKDELIEEIRTLCADVESARWAFYAAAVRLADEVVRNRNNVGDIRNVIAGLIREYAEADDLYAKTAGEATEACERISQQLFRPRTFRNVGAQR